MVDSATPIRSLAIGRWAARTSMPMYRRPLRERGEIHRQDVVELCRVGADQAKRLLARLVAEGVLARDGRGNGTRCVLGARP
jgi:hypothetical protein